MLVLWGIVFLLSIGAIGVFLPSALTTDSTVTNEPESEQGYAVMNERIPRQQPGDVVNELVIVRAAGRDVTTDAEVRKAVDDLVLALELTGATQSIRTFYDDDDPTLVSPDKDATVLTIGMGFDAEEGIKRVIEAVERVDAGPFEATITGEFTADEDFLTISNKDLKEGELFFGLPAALLVLLLVFGAVVASLVPLLLAIVAITVALALVALVGQAWELSFFVVNMLTAMGLALGVDYALFIVSRFREERGAGRAKEAAIEAAGRTASRAVLFSGTAFVIALSGMLLVPDTIMRSLAAGAVLVGITAVAAATTLLPAVLAVLGDRVDALRLPFLSRSAASEGRFWGAIVARVQRAPVVSLVVSVGILLALALPALDLRTGSAGVRTIPDGYASKDGFLALEREFGVGTVDSVEIVVDGDADAAAIKSGVEKLRRGARGRPRLPGSRGLGRPEPGHHDRRGARRRRQSRRGDRAGDRATPEGRRPGGARRLGRGHLRHRRDGRDRRLPGADGGLAPARLRLRARVQLRPAHDRLPLDRGRRRRRSCSTCSRWARPTGSSCSSSRGAWATSSSASQQVDAIEAWLPLFLFSVLFALSMDYHVFLLSRIRERYLETGDNSDAVGFGVRTTARLITGAALIIIVVFAGFASGELVMFQQMGFGIAIALLLDATVIRSVVVPAAMELLGDRNWYLPKWLEWLPRYDVEAEPPVAGAPPVSAS